MPAFSELLAPQVQAYILENLDKNTAKLALAQRPNFEPALFQEILHQIKGRQQLKSKVGWYNMEGIIVPPSLNIEQSSSELTAKKKFESVSGDLAIDGTGGYGIDTFALASKFTNVIYVEPNKALFEIVSHNATVLSIGNITFLNTSFEEAYPTLPTNAFLYLDPSRRDANQERVYKPEQYSPQLHLINLNTFNKWMVKLSPMVSITQVIEQIPSINTIQIIDVFNDCKEINILGSKEEVSDIHINTFHYQDAWTGWSGYYGAEETTTLQISPAKAYVFEPWVSVLKAGLYKQLLSSTATQKIAPNTNFYTSDSDISDFPGRRFKVLKSLKFNKREIAEATKGKAVVLNRNSKYATANEFVKQYSLVQADPNYLLLFTDSAGKQQLLLAEKLV